MYLNKLIINLLIAICLLAVSGCTDEVRDKIAAAIHDKILTVDTHVDTPLLLVSENFDLGVRHEPKKIMYKLDFPRMEEGGLDALFFAIFLFQGPRTAEGNETAKQKVLQTFPAIQKSLEQNNGGLCGNKAYPVRRGFGPWRF